MAKAVTQTLTKQEQILEWARQVAILIGASLFVAICARFTLHLPVTPVPLTAQNFAVLLVGLMLGPRRGFAALVVYLAEGAAGMPVFSLGGRGGIAQLLGPTGGYLLAYPFVAALSGWVMERGQKTFVRAAIAASLGDVVVFAGGISWLWVQTRSFSQALSWGLYWFVFAEVIKIMAAAGAATTWQRVFKVQP
jgi:biotin transport system substrate-specific component